jgi:murein L,D-transpeptidase YafK
MQQSLARPHQALDSMEAMDTQIAAVLASVEQGDIRLARLLARQLVWRFPDFQLGQLVHADLESAAAFRDVSLAPDMPISQQAAQLAVEAQRRLKADKQHVTDTPSTLIQAGKHLTQLVVVDLEASVLQQYQVDQHNSSLLRTHYIGSGEGGFGKLIEGDLKTPLGVYAITGYLAGDTLPDLYGAGALPIDYPNTLDRYLGRTGYGIWLHGVPSGQLSRTPYSSEGCVTMSNEHMNRLSRQLNSSETRVVLTNQTKQLPAAERQKLKRELKQLFSTYQQAWLNGDESTLLHLYQNHDYLGTRIQNERYSFVRVSSTDNTINPHNISAAWSEYQLAFSQIHVNDISILINPQANEGESEYPSNIVMDAWFGPNNENQITIYWSRNSDGHWQVITESINKDIL